MPGMGAQDGEHVWKGVGHCICAGGAAPSPAQEISGRQMLG